MNGKDLVGHLILLMAPSGSGKAKMVEALGSCKEELYFVRTYTSRMPREGAGENPHYQFVSREEFQSMINDDKFIEWAEFSGNYYGTLKAEVFDMLRAGKVAFKEMELQGVEQMRAIIPNEKLTVVYIDAGDWDSLKKRILARSDMDDMELEMRRARYEEERKSRGESDVIISNHDGNLEEAQNDFRNMVINVVKNIKT